MQLRVRTGLARLHLRYAPTQKKTYRANMAHIRQTNPDSGGGFKFKVLEMFQDVPSSLGRGAAVRLGLQLRVRTGLARHHLRYGAQIQFVA